MSSYTTFGIGGPARWFAMIDNELQIAPALQFAKDRNLPVLVLGGGSNLLVSDVGFPGLVLHIALKGITVAASQQDGTKHITAAAGESWDNFVQFTVERNLQGMECLAGIPGTVGGTPVQNVGAYGQEVAQTFVSARCYDMETGLLITLSREALGFAYRTSLLNTSQRRRYIVLSVAFALLKNGAPNLSYADLKRAFADKPMPSLKEVAETVRTIRRAKGMVIDASDPDSRSAGSFFRNPIVPASQIDSVAEAAGLSPQQVPHWPAGEGHVKLPAAWLLERAGFVRGTTLGPAGISSKHTLALINRGGATQRDIAALRDRILAEVQRCFGIHLEQEPVNVP